ncbi:RHS repeat-associated core domain-containing protein [Escherichia coli]|uniref:RHS repeat-associated core domain-containing protein n=1 Tax=Escherichia coli TaxID=562 RepID=UPI0039887F01
MSGKPAARQGDMTQYGGSIVQGSAGVRIGAPTGVACSVCPGGVTSGHPVNPLLGAKVLPGETDIALPGPLPFILSRTYSSYRTKTPAPVGSLGPGWKMPADIRLQLRDNTLILSDNGGRSLYFEHLFPGVYTPARKIHLYHCDHRGLPLALISTEGATAWCAEYDEWGNLLNEENPHQLQQLIRLPGQQYDEESGLYYNRHRYYDPLQGRYITQDPIGLKGGWNLYTYPLSPVNSMDPLGLYEFKSKNIDDIGIFALAMCNGESINENKEYGGLICKKQGEYLPMNPISSNDNDSVDLRNIKCPEGSERVGDYHTHGFYSDDKGNKVTKENDVYDSLNFSSKDLTNSYMNGMGKKEYSSYLGTPNNTYLKYNPKAKGNGVTIIRQGSN